MVFLNRRRFNGAVLAGGALATGVRAQGPATAPAAGAPVSTKAWEEVVAAARKEGKLVLYSGAATPKTLGPVMESFEKRYGIKVDLLFGRPSEIRERVRAEQAAGRVHADLSMDGPTINQPSFIGSYVPHEGIPNSSKLVSPFVDDGRLLPVGIGRQTVLMNTRLVKPADEPRSWFDLLDPKWRGKIVTDDPRSPGSGSLVYDVLNEKLGPQYLQKLVSQNLVVSTDISLNERRVAQGEFAFFIPFRIQSVPNLRGLPVKAMTAKEGDVYIVMTLQRVKNASRPNAARLFMNHFLDSPTQKHLLETAYGSVTGESDAQLPEDLKAINRGPLLGASEPQGLDERRKAFAALFVK